MSCELNTFCVNFKSGIIHLLFNNSRRELANNTKYKRVQYAPKTGFDKVNT